MPSRSDTRVRTGGGGCCRYSSLRSNFLLLNHRPDRDLPAARSFGSTPFEARSAFLEESVQRLGEITGAGARDEALLFSPELILKRRSQLLREQPLDALDRQRRRGRQPRGDAAGFPLHIDGRDDPV